MGGRSATNKFSIFFNLLMIRIIPRNAACLASFERVAMSFIWYVRTGDKNEITFVGSAISKLYTCIYIYIYYIIFTVYI